jgi:hypothetical protein
LERYPEAKPVREYLGEKMPGVKLKRWVVFLLLTIGLATLGSYFVHRADKSSFDSKISSTNVFYAGELAKKENDISKLEGQLSDAKSDRDKYQMMLAPFQAAALKIYTNEPLQNRLDLLANELGGLSKQSDIELKINDATNLVSEDVHIGANPVNNFITLTDRTIRVQIFNKSKYPAIKSSVHFVAPIDPTNLAASGWVSQPGDGYGRNHWRYDADSSIPRNYRWYASTIEISTNRASAYFIAECDISADNAETKDYVIGFSLQTK